MQKRTSKGTSINAAKLPRVYTLMASEMEGKTFVDYGCGRYTQHLQTAAATQNAVMLPFDPFNQPEEVNAATIAARAAADFTICSNVLNVIDDDSAVTACIASAVSMGNGTAHFTVYEGNGTGKGQETQHGQSWQRNAKLRSYAAFVPAGYAVTFSRGIMTVTA